MNVLLSGHGADRDAVDGARRTVPYDRLILLTATPNSPDLSTLKEHEALAGVTTEVHPVDGSDFTGSLTLARGIIRALKPLNQVHVHVAGGPNLVASALLLAAFQTGTSAFFCHARGVSHLPALKAVDLTERFTPAERAVLVTLSPARPLALSELEPAGMTAAMVKSTLLRLRAHGLVEANHERASLTSTGCYYRTHFLIEGVPDA